MLHPLAYATKSLLQSPFKSFNFSIIIVVVLALLSACDDGEKEEPAPVDDDPVITSFTPTTGPVGTDVVISGKNFSANVADYVVKVGTVVATVTAATTTSVSIVIPSGAVTAKISVTVKGKTAISANDFVVPLPSTDFFTLTVDASYETSASDNWVLASAKSGDWIDVQPFESGQTIKLNGVVPDPNTFTLHFLTASKVSGNDYFTMKSTAEVPVNGTWLLKPATSTSTDPKKLLLTVNNYTIPPDRGGLADGLTVSANEGAAVTTTNTAGTTISMEVDVLKSPADMIVTLYENGYPKYVSYDNVTLPSSITLDASTEGVVADRKFTMSLPTNNFYFVRIDAFELDQKHGYSMAKYVSMTGGSSLNIGYKQGYNKYRTLISYKDGKKSADLTVFGSAVEETHTFPSFDFTLTNLTWNDFQAVSDLPFDVVSIDGQYGQPGMVLLWSVVQPPVGTSKEIAFKTKAFPQEVLTKHPTLPSPNQVSLGSIYGYQYGGSQTYASMIDAASEGGSNNVNLNADNYFRFVKTQ